MLHSSYLRDEYSGRDADSAAQAIAQPHRSQAGLRERLLRDLADPRLRPVRCAIPARLFSPYGVVIGIARGNKGRRRGGRCRRGNRPCVERTLKHIGVRLDVCGRPAIDQLGRRHRGVCSQASQQFEIDDERRFVARLARDLLGAAGVGINECGARVVEYRDRLRQQFAVFRCRTRVAVGGQVVMLRRETQQPVDFLDQLDNCLLRQCRARWPERRCQVSTFEFRHRCFCGLGVFLDGFAVEGGAQVVGDAVQCVAGQRPETGLRRVAPHEEDRQRSDGRGERPAFEPRSDRTGLRGQGEGKDEHEHRRDRTLGHVPAQDAEEEHEGGSETRDDDRQPGDS
jgi:hypothetical protein